MLEVNVRELRTNLSALLNSVEQGETIVITRRGKRIAKIVSETSATGLPALDGFRRSIGVKKNGTSLSQTVIDDRREERF